MRKAKEIKLAMALLSPPGDTIQEHLEYIGMSQTELADRMGRPKEKINALIRGREPLSASTAFQLEKVLGISASFWMNRESMFRREVYQLEQEQELEKHEGWAKQFPLKELTGLGFLQEIRAGLTADVLLNFFGVATVSDWERIYIADADSVAFRMSLRGAKNPFVTSAWLKVGELDAAKLEVPEFNKKLFRDSLVEIKRLAFENPNDLTKKTQSLCAKCGVKLVYTPSFKGAKISGATRWLNNSPLIQLTDRFKRIDAFWFTFFHEAAHVILHGKKDIFLEGVQGTNVDETKEAEADRFAAKFLLSDAEYKTIVSSDITRNNIHFFAKKFGVPASIIVGRLQYEQVISFARFNDMRGKIELFPLDK